MDFNKDRYKTANKNVTDLLSFSNVNKYTMETRSKMNVFEWCKLKRNSSGKKKVKELQYAHRTFSVLINKIIYYVYECFGQYCLLI